MLLGACGLDDNQDCQPSSKVVKVSCRQNIHLPNQLIALILILLLVAALILQNVLLEPRIALSDDALDLGELARLLLHAHLEKLHQVRERDVVVLRFLFTWASTE